MSASSAASEVTKPVRRPYVPAVGARLRVLLYVVFALVALLAANALYLLSVKGLKWITGRNYGDYFYLWMILLHVVLGFLLIAPFLLFGVLHLLRARTRRNRRAVRIGYALLTTSIVILASGVLLTRVVGHFDLKDPVLRWIVYGLHVGAPLAAGWLYWLHRLAGPRINWKAGGAFAGAVGGLILVMLVLQAQDPREWGKAGSKEGEKYFDPSLVRTSDGKFIRAEVLMNDQYCMKCHPDVYDSWFHSSHRFSSFNNPAYLTSTTKLRDELLERDGNVRASRWCAGCHDPVPFLSGKFDDPDFDLINDPTGHAGITCTVCHAMTHINSNRGNADFTIEEPLHYPFAYSKSPFWQAVNNQLVKAKPEFHKESMLKPFHKTAEFCSACHKVHLPEELTAYKPFVRGQNHYDSYWLSGVSGHGAQSFYYPDKAQTNCNGCHMPLVASDDFGAKDFDGSGKRKMHSHLFPSANTGVPGLLADDRFLPSIRKHGVTSARREEIVAAHQKFLDGVMRVDIFGVKEGVTINGQLHAPLRHPTSAKQPQVPTLKRGQQYLLETVIRTMKLGHHFTQGTTDSNEVWLDVRVTSGGRIIGRSGGMSREGEVNPWAHFVNVFMLDKDGNRIDQRNAHDIFFPLYNHQIPPGAAQVAHYELLVPDDVTAPVVIEVKLLYRKFDKVYTDHIAEFHRQRKLPLQGLKDGEIYINRLPVTTLAVDRVEFPIEGVNQPVRNPPSEIPEWQRWNDYGIGLLLEGKTEGFAGELQQAEHAFQQVAALDQYHGWLNLARVYAEIPDYDKAVAALREAGKYESVNGYPTWTASWLNGVINRQQGHYQAATDNFRAVLATKIPARDFDFSGDYRVINQLGGTLYDRAGKTPGPEREKLLRQAAVQFRRALDLDSENVAAHNNLRLIYAALGETKKAEHHEKLHVIYKPDGNAVQARGKAQTRYAQGRHAARFITIYPLDREEALARPVTKWSDSNKSKKEVKQP